MVFKEGQKAVVFLARQKPPSPIDWDLYTAYVIDGTMARSEWDQKSLAVDDLLSTVTKLAGNSPQSRTNHNPSRLGDLRLQLMESGRRSTDR